MLDDKIIMATLIKLFEIKIVANNFFGLFNNSLIFKWAFVSEELRMSFSLGLREKNATSEPEINAENKRRINNRINDIIIPNEIGLKKPVKKSKVK